MNGINKAIIFDFYGVLVTGNRMTSIDGVETLLKELYEKNIPMGIASNSSRSTVLSILELYGWQKYFSSIAALDDVDYVGKPAPDLYLRAAEGLGVDPKECIAIDDSENGIMAAKAAGMCTIAFGKQVQEADELVSSFEEKETIVKHFV